MPFESEVIHPEAREDAALPNAPRPIPTDLRDCETAVERAAYFIAFRNAGDLARQDNRPNAGVSWSALGSFSTPYVGKTEAQIWAEAEAQVEGRALAMAAE